ncbi:MAG: hypothetical protein GXP29_07495 [Planctomycetes bacterium]|nr:hypothetical protein [Planctomycetota bacterium]
MSIPSVAAHVPSDAGLMIYLDRLFGPGHEFQDGGIFQLLLKLSGGNPSGWKALLAQMLGVDSNAATREILNERIAIVAPDWPRLEQGIIIIEGYNRRLLPLVVGRGRTKAGENINDISAFRTKSGLWVAVTKDTLILAQQAGKNSYFRRSIELLGGSSKASLARDAEFRSSVGALPKSSRAFVYWKHRALRDVGQNGAATDASVWSSWDSGVIGFQGRENLLEMTHVGFVSSNGARQYRPRVRFDRVCRLPQSTLASWSTSVDWRATRSEKESESTPVSPLEFLRIFAGENEQSVPDEVVENLGLRCTVILGADLAGKNLSPRIAMMVEAADSHAVIAALNRVNGFTKPGDPPSQTDTESDHENAKEASQVHTINRLAGRESPGGDTISALITDELKPSYAAIDGWVILSTSPDHVREIIDADRGVSPRLEDVLPMHAHSIRTKGAVGLVMVQPSFLHGILQFWEGQMANRVRKKKDTSQLGISVQKDSSAGQVVIVDVDSSGLANGLLHAGDRILACNGVLLEMQSPNDHLKRLLAADKSGALLRVLSGTAVRDVRVEFAVADRAHEPSRIEQLLGHVDPFRELVLNSSLALVVTDRPKNGLTQTQLAIELENTKHSFRQPHTPDEAKRP